MGIPGLLGDVKTFSGGAAKARAETPFKGA